MELVDAVEVLGLGDQQQLGVAARPDEREGLQEMAVGEVVARRHELELVLRARLVIAAPPRRVELQERVLDEVARAHSAIIAAADARAGRLPGERIQCRAVRIALVSPYSWTYPGGVTRHIEALACELTGGRARAVDPRAVRP